MPAETGAPAAIDLAWLGRPRCIAAWRAGDVLVDCGPRTCLETLLSELGDWRPRALLLTHIHFDHAGAAGELVRRWPDLEVYVHRRGARHLASPERLEASARRVFGDDFDRRFGGLTPIPEANLRPLDGGERPFGLHAIATSGHAVHHLAFLDGEGRAFVGDVAGVRLDEGGPILPPTPPPDVDVEAWLESIARVAREAPATLCLPHFGAAAPAAELLDAAAEAVRRHAEQATRRPAGDYAAWARADLAAAGVAPERRDDWEVVVPLEQNHVGLRRWADRRAGAA